MNKNPMLLRRTASFLLSGTFLLPITAAETLETRKKLAAEVIPLLEARCASCHDADAEKIHGDFGVVTDIPKLRESGHLDFQAPEASTLYLEVRDERMPELTKEEKAAGKVQPDYYTSEESAALLSWIRAGAPDLDGSISGSGGGATGVTVTTTAGGASAPGDGSAANGPVSSLPATPTLGITESRPIVTEADAQAAAVKDLFELPESVRKRTRYLSIAPLHNDATIPEETLDRMREGVAKLLNSFSTNPRVATFERVGPEGVYFRVDLDSINWSTELWEKVAAFYPYTFSGSGAEALSAVTGTKTSVMRADWLAANATRGELYNLILDLPADLKGLQAKLKIDMAANLATGKARRAGFTKSGVSNSNRLVERHEIGAYKGSLWLSYDFARSAERGNIHDFPLGPEFAGLAGGGKSYKEDGGEIIWTLPNGFYAYMIMDAKHDRLDAAPITIVADRQSVTGRPQVFTAISCLICHQHGVRDLPEDEIRPLAGGANFSAAEKELIESLYRPVEETNHVVRKDRDTFQAALAEAGIGKMGPEPIRLLVEAYEAPVKLSRAAAELGFSEGDLGTTLKNSGATLEIYTRLASGGLPRDVFEKDKLPDLGQRLGLGKLVVPGASRIPAAKPSAEATEGASAAPIVPVLTAPKAVFAEGEIMELKAVSPVDGHIRIFYQDAGGASLLLFPNPEQTSDRIKAAEPLVLSGAENPLKLIVAPPFGKETVIAVVSNQPFPDAAAIQKAIEEATDKERIVVPFGDGNADVLAEKSLRGVIQKKQEGARVGTARLAVETKAK
jgi:cytochrome c553